MSAELRPGYVKTDLGVIPESWRVRSLGEVVDFLDGQRRPVKDADRAKMQGDIPYYGASGIVDYVNDYLFDDDLILLGEDGENILSRNCKLAFRVSGKIWVNNHAHVLKPKNGNDIGFIAEFLESLDYDQYNTGTAQPKLNKQVCSAIQVLTPPLREQRAIAAALSDVDALLAKLDALIAKQRDLKQAAMQQLLTGKTRLHGFSGNWEVKPLGEICEIAMGRTPPRLNAAMWGNGHPWLSIADLKEKIVSESKEQITTLAAASMAIIPKGTLLMSFKLSIGRLCFAGCDLFTNEAICSFKKLQANPEFLYYALGRTDFSLYGKLAVKGYTLNKASLKLVEVLLPSGEEQTAIATILSDMDAEITALEARRDKTRDIKQGMMQELLTGRIRLVGGLDCEPTPTQEPPR